jgi:predicted component of type VI protein secretion system
MNYSKFKALLAALMLAFTMSVAFSGCSSSEEEESSSDVPCDIDPGQPHCDKSDIDT